MINRYQKILINGLHESNNNGLIVTKNCNKSDVLEYMLELNTKYQYFKNGFGWDKISTSNECNLYDYVISYETFLNTETKFLDKNFTDCLIII